MSETRARYGTEASRVQTPGGAAERYAAVLESDWQNTVIDALNTYGWAVWHNADSRRSDSGLPDLLCLKDAREVWIECKTERGKLRKGRIRGVHWERGQDETIRLLRAAGREVYVLRPSGTDTMHRILRGEGISEEERERTLE